MSIDEMTVVEQVAALLAEHAADLPWEVDDYPTRAVVSCDCGEVPWADEYRKHLADALADAGLLRAEQVWLDPQPVVPRPEPRVFRAGDPEPDDVRTVLDANGLIWQRGYSRGWICEDAWTDWPTMLRYEGPVVEVILPTAVTK